MSSSTGEQPFFKECKKLDYYRKQCEKCSYVDFFGPVSMQRHKWQYHTSSDELKINNFCGICAMMFENRADYNEHMEWHNLDVDTDVEVFLINNFRKKSVVSYVEKMSKADKNKQMTPEDNLAYQVQVFEKEMLKIFPKMINPDNA